MENQLLIIVFKNDTNKVSKKMITLPGKESFEVFTKKIWNKLLQANDCYSIRYCAFIALSTTEKSEVYFGEFDDEGEPEFTNPKTINYISNGKIIPLIMNIINKTDWFIDSTGKITYQDELVLQQQELTSDISEPDFSSDNWPDISEESVNQITNLFAGEYVDKDIMEKDRQHDKITKIVLKAYCRELGFEYLSKDYKNAQMMENFDERCYDAIDKVIDNILTVQKERIYVPKQLLEALYNFSYCWNKLSENWEEISEFSNDVLNEKYPFDYSFDDNNVGVIDWFKAVNNQSFIKPKIDKKFFEIGYPSKNIDKNEALLILYRLKNSYMLIRDFFNGDYDGNFEGNNVIDDNQEDINTILSVEYPFNESFDELGATSENPYGFFNWLNQSIEAINNFEEN